MGSDVNVSAVILAGGSGSRLNSDKPKQYLEIGGRAVLSYCIETFHKLPFVSEIVIVAAKEWLSYVKTNITDPYTYEKDILLAEGGSVRQQSSLCGVLAAKEPYVMIHDGARPFVSAADIERLYLSVLANKAAILAVPVTDTIKEAGPRLRIKRTLCRDMLWAARTPQAFCRKTLLEAQHKAKTAGFEGTDDAQVMEFAGVNAAIVEGGQGNIKITTNEDLLYADFILERTNGRTKL